MTNNEIQDTTLRTKRTTHKTDGEFSCSGMINIFCLTSGIHRVTNQVIRHEREKEWIVIMTNRTYIAVSVVICDTDIP